MTEAITDTYTYDTKWLDKLTSYNNQSIVYDNVGNPVNYLGHNFEWSFGRQLVKFDDNVYTYNEDGTTTLHFFYDSNDEVAGFTYNGSDYFYVKNASRDIVGISDAAGNLIASYTYDP